MHPRIGTERELRLGRTRIGYLAAVGTVESTFDDLQGQEVLALLAQDPPEPLDVGLVELAIPRRGALGVDQALALQESDLGNRQVGEVVLEEIEDFSDRQMLPLGRHVSRHRRGRRA